MAVFNDPQSRAILCGFLDIHRRMAELEAILARNVKPSPFSKYVNNLSPTEAKVIQDYFARIRTAMVEHLRSSEIALDVRPASLRWAIDVGISFIGITLAELGPKRLGGYGALDDKAFARSTRFQPDLERHLEQVARYVRQGLGRDFLERLSRLGAAHVGVETLTKLEKIVMRLALCRVPSGDRDDPQAARIPLLRNRVLWPGEFRQVVSPESHCRC
jgi:hypothetical protein